MAWLWAFLFIAGAGTLMLRDGGDAALSAMLAGAGDAVTLCLELSGAYLLFMGLIGVAKRAGLMESLSRRLAGAVHWLFPGAGKASAAIALTLSANVLGLGNAATPFGLAAMRQLAEENPSSDTASYDMCAFIAINASALQLLPTAVIALRQAAGSPAPASMVLPCIAATTLSTMTAVVLCRLLRPRDKRA
ncbi:MAG: hypothetical protein RRZ24_06955 [Clostridia bacterium]